MLARKARYVKSGQLETRRMYYVRFCLFQRNLGGMSANCLPCQINCIFLLHIAHIGLICYNKVLEKII